MPAVLMAAILSGCVSSAGNAPSPRALPPASAAGALFQPVPHPAVREGDDARAKLAETAAALTIANQRIAGARRWYETVRSRMAGAK